MTKKNFKEELTYKPDYYLTPTTLKNSIDNTVKRYSSLTKNEAIKKYFNNIIAAILLEQNTNFPNYNIDISARFKAEKSIEGKIGKEYPSFNQAEQKYEQPNISDIFALKIIASNRPTTFYSQDEEIYKLIQEKMKNHKFLEQMEKFESKITDGEFKTPKKYIYNCTKIEYFNNCIEIIKEIQSLLWPEATELKRKYDDQIDKITSFKQIIEHTGKDNSKIEESDIKIINFSNLLEDFRSRIYDKLDLAVTTKQFISLFDNNSMLSKLGVSISTEKNPNPKLKRTENGFVSNFVYIETHVGIIEVQIQSEHEYREANYGYAAHTNMPGKSIPTISIPLTFNSTTTKEFNNALEAISPVVVSAALDPTTKDRVLVQIFGTYENYKRVLSQFPKGSNLENYINLYLGELYKHRDYLNNSGQTFGITPYDLEQYIQKDPDFEQIKNNKELTLEL